MVYSIWGLSKHMKCVLEKDNLTKIPTNTNDDVAKKRDTRRITVITDVANRWQLF